LVLVEHLEEQSEGEIRTSPAWEEIRVIVQLVEDNEEITSTRAVVSALSDKIKSKEEEKKQHGKKSQTSENWQETNGQWEAIQKEIKELSQAKLNMETALQEMEKINQDPIKKPEKKSEEMRLEIEMANSMGTNPLFTKLASSPQTEMAQKPEPMATAIHSNPSPALPKVATIPEQSRMGMLGKLIVGLKGMMEKRKSKDRQKESTTPLNSSSSTPDSTLASPPVAAAPSKVAAGAKAAHMDPKATLKDKSLEDQLKDTGQAAAEYLKAEQGDRKHEDYQEKGHEMPNPRREQGEPALPAEKNTAVFGNLPSLVVVPTSQHRSSHVSTGMNQRRDDSDNLPSQSPTLKALDLAETVPKQLARTEKRAENNRKNEETARPSPTAADLQKGFEKDQGNGSPPDVVSQPAIKNYVRPPSPVGKWDHEQSEEGNPLPIAPSPTPPVDRPPSQSFQKD
jgi:hypothetical protein